MENSGGLNNLFGKHFKHHLLMLIPSRYFDGIKRSKKLSTTFKQCFLKFTRLKFKVYRNM